MSTRVIVVQPLFHVDLDDSTPAAKPVCGQVQAGETFEANGQILAALSAFLQQLAPLLLQILPLFIKPNATPSNPTA